MRCGALRTLIAYAFPSTDAETNVQIQGVAALRGIATHRALRMQVGGDLCTSGSILKYMVCTRGDGSAGAVFASTGVPTSD